MFTLVDYQVPEKFCPEILQGKFLSGGYVRKIEKDGKIYEGVLFENVLGSEKSAFLSFEKNPELKKIVEKIEIEKKQQIELAKKNYTKEKPHPGWCNKCHSYCYSDCEA